MVTEKLYKFVWNLEYFDVGGVLSHTEDIKIVFSSKDDGLKFLQELKVRSALVVSQGGSLPWCSPVGFDGGYVSFSPMDFVPFEDSDLIEFSVPDGDFLPEGFDVWDESQSESLLSKWSRGT